MTCGAAQFRTIRVEQQAEAVSLIEMEVTLEDTTAGEAESLAAVNAYIREFIPQLAASLFSGVDGTTLGEVSAEVVEVQQGSAPGRYSPRWPALIPDMVKICFLMYVPWLRLG